MQRFNSVNECVPVEYSTGTMKQSLEGTYVLYSDAQKEIERLRELLENRVGDVKNIKDLTILRGCPPHSITIDEGWDG